MYFCRAVSFINLAIWKRDFRLQVFYESVSPWSLSILLGPFRISTNIHGDIRNFVIIAGVVDTGDSALFRTFMDSMTLAINLLPVTTTTAIINRR